MLLSFIFCVNIAYAEENRTFDDAMRINQEMPMQSEEKLVAPTELEQQNVTEQEMNSFNESVMQKGKPKAEPQLDQTDEQSWQHPQENAMNRRTGGRDNTIQRTEFDTANQMENIVSLAISFLLLAGAFVFVKLYKQKNY